MLMDKGPAAVLVQAPKLLKVYRTPAPASNVMVKSIIIACASVIDDRVFTILMLLLPISVNVRLPPSVGMSTVVEASVAVHAAGNVVLPEAVNVRFISRTKSV